MIASLAAGIATGLLILVMGIVAIVDVGFLGQNILWSLWHHLPLYSFGYDL